MMPFRREGRALLVVMSLLAIACGKTAQAPLKELQRAHSGSLDVVLLSSTDALREGKNSAMLEFRSADGALVDVGSVRLAATMPMAGMAPMMANTEVRPADVKGRYAVDGSFGMTGLWRMTIEWDGPAGMGKVSMPGTVR